MWRQLSTKTSFQHLLSIPARQRLVKPNQVKWSASSLTLFSHLCADENLDFVLPIIHERTSGTHHKRNIPFTCALSSNILVHCYSAIRDGSLPAYSSQINHVLFIRIHSILQSHKHDCVFLSATAVFALLAAQNAQRILIGRTCTWFWHSEDGANGFFL